MNVLNYITYNTVLAHICGVEGAILLSVLCEHNDNNKEFFIEEKFISKISALSSTAIKKAKKTLLEMGILQFFPKKNSFKINEEKLVGIFTATNFAKYNIISSNNIYNKRNYNKEKKIIIKKIYSYHLRKINVNYTSSKIYYVDKNYISNNTIFNSKNNDNYMPTNISSNVYNYIPTIKEKTKENIYKSSNINSNIKEKKKENSEVQEIFDYYNTLGLKKMRALNEKTEKAIKKALKEYSKEQIFEMISRFKCIVNDEYYYYNYKWNAEEFFCRKEGYRRFADDGEKWVNYISQRPSIKTEQYFKPLWDMYPNKNGERSARKEFQNKFIGLNSGKALEKARYIYKKCRDYVNDTDETYVMNLERWLKENV